MQGHARKIITKRKTNILMFLRNSWRNVLKHAEDQFAVLKAGESSEKSPAGLVLSTTAAPDSSLVATQQNKKKEKNSDK